MEFHSSGCLLNLPSAVSETSSHVQCGVTSNSLAQVEQRWRGWLADEEPLQDCLLLIIAGNHSPVIRTTGQRQQSCKVGKWPKFLPGDASEGVSEALDSCPSCNQLNKYLPPKRIKAGGKERSLNKPTGTI